MEIRLTYGGGGSPAVVAHVHLTPYDITLASMGEYISFQVTSARFPNAQYWHGVQLSDGPTSP